MPISLSGRNFLKLLDYTPDEIRYLLRLSKQFKNLKLAGTPHRYFEGKNTVLLFEEISTRMRCAPEVTGMDLGMGATYLDPGNSQIGARKSIADTAQVPGRMYDGIEYHGSAQKIVEELAENAGMPVWNGLTTKFHPTQMIADMLTVKENFPGGLKGPKFVFMGDAQDNVANSLMVVCSKPGLHFVTCDPKDLIPEESLVAQYHRIVEETGVMIALADDVDEVVSGTYVVYTDIWVSVGEPAELWEKRIRFLKPYRVTSQVVARAGAEVILMRCLPSFHDTNATTGTDIVGRFGATGVEVSDKVFRSAKPKVMDEAESRIHTIKAVVYTTLS